MSSINNGNNFSLDSIHRYTPAELFECLNALGKGQDPDKTHKISQVYQEIARRGFSLDIIEPLLKRTLKVIPPEERSFLQGLRRHLPHLNKALISYELLQKKTEKMDLSDFKKGQIDIQGESIDVYYASKEADYQYIIHSAESIYSAESVIDRKKKQTFLCCSLVSPDTNFYKPDESYGIILSCDPRSLVTGTREDAFTPYNFRDDQTRCLQFYSFYQRLQIFTGYVDELYRGSGIRSEHPTDDLSQINRLSSMQEMNEESRNTLQAVKNGREESELINQYAEGVAAHQLKALARYYKDDPAKLREVERCSEILENYQRSGHFHDYIHPLQEPGEILRQTGFQRPNLYNYYGLRPYNEINIDLRTYSGQGKNLIEVKGVLIDRSEYDKCPGRFHDVIKEARSKNWPIIFKELAPPSSLSVVNAFKVMLPEEIINYLNRHQAEIGPETAKMALVVISQRDMYNKVEIIERLRQISGPLESIEANHSEHEKPEAPIVLDTVLVESDIIGEPAKTAGSDSINFSDIPVSEQEQAVPSESLVELPPKNGDLAQQPIQIAANNRVFDPDYETFCKEIENGNLKAVQDILRTMGKELTPSQLGWGVYYAIKKGRADIAELILSRGLDVDKEVLGMALDLAVKNNRADIASSILESSHEIDSHHLNANLSKAWKAKDRLIVHLILASKRKLDSSSLYAVFALAAEEKDKMTVRFCLENGQLAEWACKKVLEQAKKAGNEEIAEIIDDEMQFLSR